MTRDAVIARAHAYFDDADGYWADLARRVAIPTECQKPERLPVLYQYLEEEMRPCFEAIGYTCRVYDNPMEGMGPALLATRTEDKSLPTILGYGHGDVVRGHEGRWSEDRDPWKLSRDGDKVYGRGTADNKGQHSVHMGALKSVIEERGHLGFNSKFIIETGEENGSWGFKDMVALHKDDFAADFYFASDGPRVDMAKPNLTLGCRGTRNFDLVLDMREGGHHSGNWGGLLANPGVILGNAIATITDVNGKILVDGWRPPPISNSVRDALKDVKREGGPNAPEINMEWGEPGLTEAEKVLAWNTFEVLAFVTGNPDKPVNAVPPRAHANCQLRYVVGTDPELILPALRRHLDGQGYPMIEIHEPPAENSGRFNAARTDPDHSWASWMKATVQRMTGEPTTILPNSGGSICNDVFQDVLGIPFVWMPLSYTGCSQHAPNEHILWSLTREGMGLVTGVYWDLGDPETAYRP